MSGPNTSCQARDARYHSSLRRPDLFLAPPHDVPPLCQYPSLGRPEVMTVGVGT